MPSDNGPIVRVYKGHDQNEAARKYAKDAISLALAGYQPSMTSWADGRAGCLRFLLIGPFAWFWRPDGSLTVTYLHQPTIEPPPDVAYFTP